MPLISLTKHWQWLNRRPTPAMFGEHAEETAMKTRILAMLAVISALGLPAAVQASLTGILPKTAGRSDYQA